MREAGGAVRGVEARSGGSFIAEERVRGAVGVRRGGVRARRPLPAILGLDGAAWGTACVARS